MTVRASAMIVQGVETRDANGNIHQPFPPRPSEGIGDDHRTAPQAGEQTARRGIRIIGQNGREIALDVRLIDTRVGADQTMPRLGDYYTAIHFDDASRLRKDQFDQASILLPFGRPGSSQRRRVNLAQIHHGPFRFRGDLLRHGKHHPAIHGLPFCGRGLTDQCCEVIARPHFGQRREGYDFDAHAARRKDET